MNPLQDMVTDHSKTFHPALFGSNTGILTQTIIKQNEFMIKQVRDAYGVQQVNEQRKLGGIISNR